MHRTTVRAIALGALATTAVAVPASSALAASAEPRLLGLPLPDLGQIVTDVGSTLGGTIDQVLPGTGAIVTETTGTVGGIITGTTGTVETVVDQTLGGILDGSGLGEVVGPDTNGGGSAGGLLPTDALTQLLLTLGIPVSTATSGQVTQRDGTIVLDNRAPGVTFTVLSKLRSVKKDGKLKLRVATDEPGVVAFTSAVRPGPAVKAKKPRKGAKVRKAPKHSRKLIKVPAVTLGFRKAGTLRVTVQLSKTAQRNLGNARNARISVGLLASDAARNQARTRVKRAVKR